MSKNKKIFIKPDDEIPSPEQILNYLNQEMMPGARGGSMDKNISRKKSKEESGESESLSPSMDMSSFDEKADFDATVELPKEELKKSFSVQPSASSFGSNKKKRSSGQDNKSKHDLEKKMLESSLIGEAVEGFSLVIDKEKAKNIINDINDSIEQRSSKKDRWVIYRRTAALALLLLLFGGGFWFFNNSLSENSVAVMNKKTEITSGQKSDTTIDENNVGEKTISDIAIKRTEKTTDKKSEEKPSLPLSNNIFSDGIIEEEPVSGSVIQKDEVGNNSPKGLGNSKSSSVSHQEIQGPIPGVMSDDRSRKEPAPVVEPSLSRSEMKDSKRMKSKKEEELSNDKNDLIPLSAAPEEKVVKANKVMIGVDKGIELYNEAKYKESSEIFQGVIDIQPQNQIGLYYNGLAYYKLNELDLALKNFSLVIQKSRYYYDAQWYKSEIYLIKKETGKAKVILKQLSRPDNPYWERAIVELKKIQ